MSDLIRTSNRRVFFEAFSDGSPIVREILSFLRLPQGWYFGEGQPPADETASYAIAVATALSASGAECLEAFPDSDGGILVAGYHNDETIEVLCRPHGAFDFIYEQDESEVENLTGLNFRNVMQKIRAWSWRDKSLSDFCIRSILAHRKEDTKDWHSKTLPMAGFPLLTPVVLALLASRYVTISSDTTHWQSRANLPFFGASATPFFRRVSF